MIKLSLLLLCYMFLTASICSIHIEGADLNATGINLDKIAESNALPGRDGSDEVYYTQIDEAGIFFYMTPEKEALARQFVEDVNMNMKLTMAHPSSPSAVSEIKLLATRYASEESADPSGSLILNAYSEETKKIIEKLLGFHIKAVSCDIELTANYDALKIHRDPCVDQCEYIASAPLAGSDYSLIQDLTLIDWQMAKGTFAATMVQDGNSGDRFLLMLFPGEVLGTLFTQRVDQNVTNDTSISLNTFFFLPHASIAPTDHEGSKTVGTWKGKKINTVLTGVVPEEEVIEAAAKATLLPINRPEKRTFGAGLQSIEYSNGVVIRECHHSVDDVQSLMMHKLEDQENVTILEMSPQDHKKAAQLFNEMFGLQMNLSHVFRLIKKDRGFSRFDRMLPSISSSSMVVIVNRSHLPEGYKYFNFAEDCTRHGKPWIHLYEFPPQTAMMIPADVLQNALITTLEELLYRNESNETESVGISCLKEKLVTEFDVFILN